MPRKEDYIVEDAAMICTGLRKALSRLKPILTKKDLAREVGLDIRNVQRYLKKDAHVDMPIAALHKICLGLHLKISDVLPLNEYWEKTISKQFSPISDKLTLSEVNDCIVMRLFEAIKEEITSNNDINGIYDFSLDKRNPIGLGIDVTFKGLKWDFTRKENGHYPLMSTSTALSIAQALKLDPDNYFL